MEVLKERLSLSWGELATHLHISRSMLDFLRNGKRQPSPKMMRSITAVELSAGIAQSSHGLEPKPISHVVMERSPDFQSFGKSSTQIHIPKNGVDRSELMAIRSQLLKVLERVDKALGDKNEGC
ncbi:MAG: helix-turn-helix transcriptional regulator [Lentisphaerota bacterium]